MDQNDDIQARAEARASEHWQWVKEHKDQLMLGAIVILSLRVRGLKHDNAKLLVDKAKLIIENSAIKETVMNVKLVTPEAVNHESLFDVYFGAKK